MPTPRGARARASRSLLTVAEVASRLGISKMAVYRLIHSGELAAIRVGRTFRVPEVVVEEMAAELQRHSGTA
ncbi:excisionase family DNA-binding protein [Streptomyces phaeochromogenes]